MIQADAEKRGDDTRSAESEERMLISHVIYQLVSNLLGLTGCSITVKETAHLADLDLVRTRYAVVRYSQTMIELRYQFQVGCCFDKARIYRILDETSYRGLLPVFD